MSKKELKQILQSNKDSVKSDKPANIEEDLSYIGSLKTIRSIFQSPASGISTSVAIDMIEDVITYMIQLQEIIKIFRQVNYMEDHGEARSIPPEITEQYNKYMKYNNGDSPFNLNPAQGFDAEPPFTQEEMEALLAPPTPHDAIMRFSDVVRLGSESSLVTDEERVSTELILDSYEIESLQDMVNHAGLCIEMGPQANEREILVGLISNNPSILERWLHAGSPQSK